MSDDLLARAKALVQASNAISNITFMPSQPQEVNIINSPSPQKSKATSLAGSPNNGVSVGCEFKGAVFTGSTLVTTYKDMRKVAPQGSTIVVDGIRCKVSHTGEWSANRLELTEDFKGETNLDANIQPSTKSNVGKKKVKKTVEPIPHNELAGALSGLEDVRSYVNQLQTGASGAQAAAAPKIKKKKSVTNHPSLSKRAFSGAPPVHAVVNLEPRHFDADSHEGPHTLNVNQPTISVTEGQISRTSSVEGQTGLRRAQLSQEELNMLNELESMDPQTVEQRRIDMNNRLVEKGLSRANERVAEFKQNKQPAVAENLSPNSYLAKYQMNSCGDSETVPSYVEQQRLAAALRVKQRIAQEDAEIMRKLHDEEIKEKAHKEQMEKKAEALKQKTAERVAELKRQKREKARKEKEKREQELRAKMERENDEDAIADRLQRIEQIKEETEARLMQRSKQKDDYKKQQQHQYDWKLKQMAVVNKRELPTLAYIMTNNAALNKQAEQAVEALRANAPPGEAVILPPIAMRSKSEQSSHRSPKKDSRKVQKPKGAQKKISYEASSDTDEPLQPQPRRVDVDSQDRVIVESRVNSGLGLPAAQNQSQLDHLLANHAQQQKEAAKIAKFHYPANVFGAQHQSAASSAVPSDNEDGGYNGDAGDDDDDFDDLEDDSLSGHNDLVFQANKKKNVGYCAPHNGKSQYDDGIVMGYDDESAAEASRSKKSIAPSVAMSKAGTHSKQVQGHESKIPRRVANQPKAIPAATQQNISSKQTGNRLSNVSDDDAMSDISSVEGRNYNKQPRRNNGLAPSFIEESDKPRQTQLQGGALASGVPSASFNKKPKKPKDPVWKVPPIPIRPYIAVPTNS